MRIIFYCSEQETVNFIDDSDVQKLGELSIDIGRPFQSVEDKTVKVTLVFGSTQINATATNKEGTEIRNCEFQFETSGTAVPTLKKPEEKKKPLEEKKVNNKLNVTEKTQDQTTDLNELTMSQQFVDQLNNDLNID